MIMKLCVIGTGNMARAVIGGILKNGILTEEDMIASNPRRESLDALQALYSVEGETDNARAVRAADVIILAVKPQKYDEVIDGIADAASGKLIVSLAAGRSIARIRDRFARNVRIVRVMPNTPALIGEGMIAYSAGDDVKSEELSFIRELLSSLGRVIRVDEGQMDAVVAVSGSAPAYVFMMIEAMADAAVGLGMPRAQAYEMAAQTVAGSAELFLQSGKHPGELKDAVCSPGGTTIEAVRVLESRGFRQALIEAMRACGEKSAQMERGGA